MIWMQYKHIPEMIATGKFVSAKMARVLIEEEMGGVTYSVQYVTDSKETLLRYYIEDAPALRDEGEKLFGEKMLSFRTELEVISEH
jgi:phosphoribosylamine-glycine ligase